MNNFHDVKIAAARATLRQYGLDKTATIGLLPELARLLENPKLTGKAKPSFFPRIGDIIAGLKRTGQSAGIGGAIGAGLGAARGFYEGPAREEGAPASFYERLQNAGQEGLRTGLLGAAVGGLHGLSKVGPEMGRAGTGETPNLLRRLFTANTAPDASILKELPRELIFGSPLTLARRHNVMARRIAGPEGPITAKHHLQALGKGFKNYYWAPPTMGSGLLGKGLHYGTQALGLGLSGLDLYNAAKTDDPNVRRGDIASAVAGLATAPLTSRLGIPGAILSNAVRTGARKLVQKDTPRYTPAYDPEEHLLLALKGLRSYGDAGELPST